MVLASHVIFTTYGFWLPNDPRGSWSDFVAAWELFRAGGPATKTTTRRSVAGAPPGQRSAEVSAGGVYRSASAQRRQRLCGHGRKVPLPRLRLLHPARARS